MEMPCRRRRRAPGEDSSRKVREWDQEFVCRDIRSATFRLQILLVNYLYYQSLQI